MKLQIEERNFIAKTKSQYWNCKNENKGEREEKPKTKNKNGEREARPKLEPWCCYIVFQPQSLHICFKFNPINKIRFDLDKIRFDKIVYSLQVQVQFWIQAQLPIILLKLN